MRQAAAFGATLRRERERRGVSLEAIAEETKVGLALLEALERGDLARWPTGIFRRAFVRAYAEAAGLDARAVLNEFLRIFPDEDLEAAVAAPPVDFAAAEPLHEALRITFADETGLGLRAALRRCALVGADLVVVAAVSAGAKMAGVAAPWPELFGMVGVVYFACGVIAAGTSPASWWLQRRSRPRRAAHSAASASWLGRRHANRSGTDKDDLDDAGG